MTGISTIPMALEISDAMAPEVIALSLDTFIGPFEKDSAGDEQHIQEQVVQNQYTHPPVESRTALDLKKTDDDANCKTVETHAYSRVGIIKSGTYKRERSRRTASFKQRKLHSPGCSPLWSADVDPVPPANQEVTAASGSKVVQDKVAIKRKRHM